MQQLYPPLYEQIKARTGRPKPLPANIKAPCFVECCFDCCSGAGRSVRRSTSTSRKHVTACRGTSTSSRGISLCCVSRILSLPPPSLSHSLTLPLSLYIHTCTGGIAQLVSVLVKYNFIWGGGAGSESCFYAPLHVTTPGITAALFLSRVVAISSSLALSLSLFIYGGTDSDKH